MPTYSAPLAEDSNGVTRPYRQGDLPRSASYAYGPNRVEVTTDERVETYENADAVDVLEPDEPEDAADEDSDGPDGPVEPELEGYECGECGDAFDSKRALAGHMSSHSRE